MNAHSRRAVGAALLAALLLGGCGPSGGAQPETGKGAPPTAAAPARPAAGAAAPGGIDSAASPNAAAGHPASAASAAEAGASTGASAQAEPLPGALITARYTPLFAPSAWPHPAIADMDVYAYEPAGERLALTGVSGEWFSARNDSLGEVWIPRWYGGKEAEAIRAAEPAVLRASDSAALYLAPGSSQSWSRPDWPESVRAESLVSFLRWKDWRGVLLASSLSYRKDSGMPEGVLLWIRESDIEAVTPLSGGGLAQSGLDPALRRAAVTAALPRGTSEAEAAALLGEPTSREPSGSLNEPGEPLRIGTVWRYEEREPELEVTFDRGSVSALTWTVSPDTLTPDTSSPDKSSPDTLTLDTLSPDAAVPERGMPVRPVTSYTGSVPVRYHLRLEEPAPGRRLEPKWTSQGELAYMYLRHITPDALILFGDDGGLSGMHMQDNLYAVDRSTGRKLWQIDGGFGWSQTAIDRDRTELTVFLPYTPGKGYEYRLRHLNAATGRTLWEKKLSRSDGSSEYTRMYSAEGVVLLYGHEPASSAVKLRALDEDSGRTLWEKKLPGEPAVLNEGGEAAVLLRQGATLTGLAPRTGRLVWSLTGKDSPGAGDDAAYDPYLEPAPLPADPAASGEPVRWFRLGGERLRVDLATGRAQARAAAAGELIGADGTLLLTREYPGELASDRQSPEIVLTDAATGKEQWRLKGRGGPAVFAGETLYLYLNGPLAALDAKTGKTLWTRPLSKALYSPEGYADPLGAALYALPGNRLLAMQDGGVLVVRASDGQTLYRLSGVPVGFPEARDGDIRRGLVKVDGRDLYLGSDGGRFFKIGLPLP